jgi:hypothetical protein
VVDPHTAPDLENGNEDEDEGNPDEHEFQRGAASPVRFPPWRHGCTLICTVRVTLSLPISRPGIGIMLTPWYVTETEVAGLPSVPVTEEAVTVSGDALHPDMPLRFGKEESSARTLVQAVDWSAATEELLEVYSAAIRAAFSTEMRL